MTVSQRGWWGRRVQWVGSCMNLRKGREDGCTKYNDKNCGNYYEILFPCLPPLLLEGGDVDVDYNTLGDDYGNI